MLNIIIDDNRDKFLESLEFTVLSFENRFYFRDPEYLKSEIRKVKKKKLIERQINHPGREVNFVNIR